MRTPTGAAGLIVAALYLTACEADNTGPGPDTGGGRSEPAALTATPAQLVFRIYAFDPERDPPAQILQVDDGGTLDWTANTHTSWIRVWHSGAPGRLVVGLDRTHMSLLASDDRPPVLRTTITLSAAGASNSPVQIPVVVLISYVPPDKLGPGGNPDPR